MGAFCIDSRTRGTGHYALFKSRRDTHIANRFESGNLSAWSYAANDGGDLRVTTGSALARTSGMTALLDENYSMSVEDREPEDGTQHRQGFYCPGLYSGLEPPRR